MSLESEIVAALSPLVGGRVYPDIAPKAATLPRLTYQAVGGDSINYVDTATPGVTNARVQVNVWAATRLGASTLARQVREALRTSPTLRTWVLGEAVAVHEPDTGLYGARQDFSLWST